MSERLFTADNAWHGGFYELALELGPRSDERLQAALVALWSHPDLDGCFEDRSQEPANQVRVAPRHHELDFSSHLFGLAKLANGMLVNCGSYTIREDDGPDWVDLYLPMGGLGTAYPVGGYPFETDLEPNSQHESWRTEVEDWLAGVGLWVARTAKYRLGLIGFEVSGEIYAEEIASRGIPAKRYIGYLWPGSNAIEYHRRTET